MDKSGRVGEFTRCSVFSCGRVYACIFSHSFAFFLVEPYLFFFPFQFFFLIILLCGEPNLSEGRSIMLRCNSVAGIRLGRGGEVGKIAFNGDVFLLRLERYISARPSCV